MDTSQTVYEQSKLDLLIARLRQPNIKYLLILGALGMSAVWGFIGPDQYHLYIIGALAGLGGIIIFLRYQNFWLPTLILAAMIVPISLGGDPSSSLNAAVLGVLGFSGLWVLDMVSKRQVSFQASRTNLPFLGLIITAVISMIAGQVMWFVFARQASLNAQIAGLVIFIMSGLTYWLAANRIADLVWLKRTVFVFLALGAVYTFGRIVPGGYRWLYSLFQYGSDASVYWIWISAFSGSMLLYNKDLSKFWRILCGLILAGTFYIGMILTYDWKSGWVPAAVALIVVVWFGYPRLRVFLAIAAILILLISFSQLQAVVTGNEDYSITTRYDAWLIVIQIGMASPIIGLGPATYRTYTPLFNILGYNIEFNSHNNYIDIFAQTGIVGLAFYIWFLVEFFRFAMHMLNIAPAGFPRSYAIASLAGLTATIVTGMLGDWVFPFVYNVGLPGFRSAMLGWVFFGGLVALERILITRSASGVAD